MILYRREITSEFNLKVNRVSVLLKRIKWVWGRLARSREGRPSRGRITSLLIPLSPLLRTWIKYPVIKLKKKKKENNNGLSVAVRVFSFRQPRGVICGVGLKTLEFLKLFGWLSIGPVIVGRANFPKDPLSSRLFLVAGFLLCSVRIEGGTGSASSLIALASPTQDPGVPPVGSFMQKKNPFSRGEFT